MPMTREQRLALIEELRIKSDATAIEIAQRRAAREAAGDFDPLPTIGRSNDDLVFGRPIDNNVETQQRAYSAPQPTPQQTGDETMMVTLGYLAAHTDALVDATADHVREMITPLTDRIAALERELALIRGTISGDIKMIEGRRHAAAN